MSYTVHNYVSREETRFHLYTAFIFFFLLLFFSILEALFVYADYNDNINKNIYFINTNIL